MEASIRSNPAIYLASASPRRRQLLAFTGWQVQVRPAEVEEAAAAHESPEEHVRRLAWTKAQAIIPVSEGDGVVVAADTIVVDGDAILGKPADAAEARQILLSLRGRSHRVLTGLALRDLRSGRTFVEVCESWVMMRNYTASEVDAYVATGSPLDKAGAYGIQDSEFQPVEAESVRGCFANIMGLPLCRLVHGMRSLGYQPPDDPTADCSPEDGNRRCVVPGLLAKQRSPA